MKEDGLRRHEAFEEKRAKQLQRQSEYRRILAYEQERRHEAEARLFGDPQHSIPVRDPNAYDHYLARLVSSRNEGASTRAALVSFD